MCSVIPHMFRQLAIAVLSLSRPLLISFLGLHGLGIIFHHPSKPPWSTTVIQPRPHAQELRCSAQVTRVAAAGQIFKNSVSFWPTRCYASFLTHHTCALRVIHTEGEASGYEVGRHLIRAGCLTTFVFMRFYYPFDKHNLYRARKRVWDSSMVPGCL